MNRLFLGDARRVLRSLPDGCADCAVFDPPYDVISGGNQARPDQPAGILKADQGESFTGSGLNGGKPLQPREYLHDLYRVMRDPSHIYMMTNFHSLEESLRQLRLAGFEIHNLLVAHKQNTVPNRWYMKNCEYTILARKGKAFPINDCGSKTVHDFGIMQRGEKLHDAQKPVALMEFYIRNSSVIGDTVIDPFCGSGSTLVAANRAGRRFIGIDNDPEHIKTSVKRTGAIPGIVT